MNLSQNVKTLGQVFTPKRIVRQMLSLRQNNGRVLEPCSGRNAFLSSIEDVDAIGIEFDETLGRNDSRVRYGDFFAFNPNTQISTIIGNPPYVRFKYIGESTKALLPTADFDRRSNLYLFFIHRCMELLPSGGEMIFITPRDFTKATSSRILNGRLYQEGSFTHFEDLGDEIIFKGFAPNCAIWRWEKGRASRQLDDGRFFRFYNGIIWFSDEPDSNMQGMSNYFDIKVGAVSGADPIYTSHEGNRDFVCSTTAVDGETRRMIYQQPHSWLEPYKDKLLARRIRQFDESNWWEWGREYHNQEGPRIYVNCKTRNENPFFASDHEAYDGAVLALFPRSRDMYDRMGTIADRLNAVDWDSLGFMCANRYIFSQRSLMNAPVSL